MVFYRKKESTFSKKDEKRLRKNEEIFAREVNLIDEKGIFVGVVSKQVALEMAQEAELDLVEVSPNTNPPTCKIMSYGKYIYEQKKKTHKFASKDQKTVRLTFNMAENDLLVRVNQVNKFLEKGHAVKIELQFRGREESHEAIGREKFDIFLEKLRNKSAGFKIVNELKKQAKIMSLSIEPDAKLKK
ncbi:MAG: hypothetical protein Fur0024_4370 [Patescibacteria group bacterium]